MFSSSRVYSLLSFLKNEYIILFFINIRIENKIRLKNNLSKSNKSLRDVNTKRRFDDNQTTLKIQL